jgi:hypothetical protein
MNYELLDLFNKSPVEAFEQVLTAGEKSLYKSALIFTSCDSKDGRHYGSYKRLTRKDLLGRKYNIGMDHNHHITLHFTDGIYIPETYQFRRFKNE